MRTESILRSQARRRAPGLKTTDQMALKFFTDTIILLKVDQFEGILNWIKIDGMVNDHSSSCNS